MIPKQIQMNRQALEIKNWNMFKDIKAMLEEEGFTQVEGADERYMEKDNIQIFNCPHKCGSIAIFSDFPRVADYKAFDNIKDYQNEMAEKTVHRFIGRDIHPRTSEEVVTELKARLDGTFSI